MEILQVQTTVITAIRRNRLLQAAVNRDRPIRTISLATSRDHPLRTISQAINRNHHLLAAVNLPAANKAHRRLAPAISLHINHLTVPEVITPQVPQRRQNPLIPMVNVNTQRLIYPTKQTALDFIAA